MTFNELMDGLAAKYSIDGLAADGGILSLQIDGMSATIVEGGDDAFVVTGVVCEPPAENGELFANMLLDATIGLMDARSAALARNPASRAYVLVERISANLDLDAFCAALETFVNTLEDSRRIAVDFRPAMAAAREKLKESEWTAGAGSVVGGIMQV